MMLFDVDNFKTINDTYGHETGDMVLIKLVEVLKRVFRDDDCICRIGGDEFVVFMVHSGNIRHRLIESKIGQINAELENTDAAMYESKKSGKGTYTFHS
ncbi:MAG: GGDEF domain-containing protein [Lachnospiraceae bacterium]|nr:GGDEF domain-containing protein [Lachnospiraceae bacterium]